MPTPDDTLPSSVRPVEPFSLEASIRRIEANSDLAVEYGREANERLGVIERRLEALERHVGMNGKRDRDTVPAPVTEPENERPGEV
ncbi:MAG: hypothetical protein AMXMBFR56_67930 [Polyangiaceae bacterium]